MSTFRQQIRRELPPRAPRLKRCYSNRDMVLLAPDQGIVPYSEELDIQAERDPPLTLREWEQEIGEAHKYSDAGKKRGKTKWINP
jgi:hypothetical protein